MVNVMNVELAQAMAEYNRRHRPCYTYKLIGWLWRMAWAIPMTWVMSLEGEQDDYSIRE